MPTSIKIGLSITGAPGKGVPVRLVIDGIAAILLLSADGAPLQGADGAYLYGAE